MALTREILLFSRLGNVNNVKKIGSSLCIQNTPFLISVRGGRKHYNPQWKWHRGRKTIPIDIPDFHLSGAEKRETARTRLKELGIESPRYWKERPMTITSIPNIISPYVPPDGDGKTSYLSREGAKELISNLALKKDTLMAVRKIKSYDENFDVKLFPQHAQDIYIKAHNTLMKKDPEELIEFVTDMCLSRMIEGIKHQTLRWKFIKSLEPPIVVQARTTPAITNNNHFAQVTVRFHTQQSLAIYDRFGRLMYGSEIVPKDVLEYVVFEKHIVNVYGIWRMHAKIIPDWMAPADPSARTYVVTKEVPEDDLYDDEDFEDENLAEAQSIKEGSEEAEVKK